MKRIICSIAVLFFLFSPLAQAQITNVSTPDSTITIGTIYGGLLSATNFSYDSLHTSNYLSLLTGFSATYKPVDWLSIITADGYKIDNEGKTSVFTRFWTKVELDALQVEAGMQPSPATELRPSPISSDGQFESWTEGTIPGGSLGVKARYSMDGSNSIGIGVTQRKGLAEYHFRYSYKQWKLAIYYPEWKKKIGAALRFDGDDFSNVSSLGSDNTFGNFTSVKINRKSKLEAYLDFGQDLAAKKLIKLEIGLLKKFSTGVVKGLMGLSYNYDNRSIIGYLFVHI